MQVDVNDEEIRDLAKRTLALTEENNRILKGMRSSARWGRFFSIVWWIIIIAVSGAAYYYYLEPYVQKAEQLYNQIGQSGQQAENYGAQFAEFLKKFGKQP
ncbi:hypothetical protein K2Q00_02585 [Patescibacteria group bacterium]|nr:hypothetical protein [Patescibacteria group bacterium]